MKTLGFHVDPNVVKLLSNLDPEEKEMIHNIFEFGDKEAKDIMTHRNNIVAIDGNMSFYDMVAYVDDTGKSRFPVYLDDIDNIIGVLHIKDALLFAQKNDITVIATKRLDSISIYDFAF